MLEHKIMPLHHVFEFIIPFLATTAVERGVCDLNTVSSCICLNGDISYTCVVNGPGFTIWRGSAFECSAQLNRILLRHASFESGTMGLCNDGAIVGRSLAVSDGVYTSQLTVSVTSNLIGRIIECSYSLTGATVSPINSTTIEISDPFPPPLGVKLTNVTADSLTFNWDPVDLRSSCPTLQYSTESDCGNCSSNSLNTTSITCSFDLSFIANDVCSFSVRTITCGDVMENYSEPISILLKVPITPSIRVTPTYNMEGNLSRMRVTFSEVDSFSIFDGIDGAALQYTLTIVNSNTNISCNTTNVLPSSCSNRVCNVTLNYAALSCSTVTSLSTQSRDMNNIIISVSASNVLGTGPESHVILGVNNQYVNVKFKQKDEMGTESTRIFCIFLNSEPENQLGQSEKSCMVVYRLCEQQNMTSQVSIGNSVNISTVVIDLPVNFQSNAYCYVINASNGSFSVLVEDQSQTDVPSGQSRTTWKIATGIVVPIVLLLLAIAVIVLMFVFKKIYDKRKAKRSDRQTEPIPGDDATVTHTDDPQEIINAHICFDLEDKPKQLLKALNSLMEILSNINIKNIKIGPLQGKVRRIYIENESELSKEEKESIDEHMKFDGNVSGKLEVSLTRKPKSISRTRSEENLSGKTVKTITEVLKHEPGALCALINAVLSIDDDSGCMRINITDITVEDYEGITSKRVTIKFIPVLEDTWKQKYDENKLKGEICEFIVNSGSSSGHE